MSFLLESMAGALDRILHLDADLFAAVATTLRVSATSTTLATLVALPAGFLLARSNFRGKGAAMAALKTALAVPTVVVALLVYAFIAQQSPLGRWNLLYTRAAIVIGQVILIVPLMTALVHGVLEENVRAIYEEARLLGASRGAALRKTLAESRGGVITAVMTGFGRVAGEIGISLILGGNIRGSTRTMTTAIALRTGQGDFAQAMALGIVLLVLVLAVNAAIQILGLRHEDV